MVLEMLQCIVFYLNAFPWTGGVLTTESPMTLLEGTYLDFNLHFKVIFGKFGMVYTGIDNTMNLQAVGAIAMGLSGNYQGRTKWFSLATGEILHQKENDFQLLPMTANAIKQVYRMAKKSPKGLVFCEEMESTKMLETDSTSINVDNESRGVSQQQPPPTPEAQNKPPTTNDKTVTIQE